MIPSSSSPPRNPAQFEPFPLLPPNKLTSGYNAHEFITELVCRFGGFGGCSDEDLSRGHRVIGGGGGEVGGEGVGKDV